VKEKKTIAKSKKEAQKKLAKLNPDALITEEDKKRRAELELLVNDGKNGAQAEFKPDSKDKRFSAIMKNKDFSIDPTHKEYRKVADGEFVKT
jgi:hypothetical protein